MMSTVKSKFRSCLLLVLIAFGLSSCGNFGHHNFNKQKYTNLKHKTSFSESPQDEIVSLEEENFIEEHLVIEDEPAENNEFKIENQRPEDLTELESKEAEPNLQEKTQREMEEQYVAPVWRERRDYNKLEEAKKKRALIVFNQIFNVGLFLIILAAILAFCGLILILNGIAGSLWIYLVWVGAGLLFIDWILSLVALNRVRNIDVLSRTKRFRIKYRLAQVVAYIGILICVIGIFAGILFGILWATRAISF